MSATGLEAFDRTVQTTNIWLHEIIEDLGPDRGHAWHVLGGVLRTLRDQLPVELAAHFAAQLPLLIRGAFYEAWNPGSASRKAKSEVEFLDKLHESLSWTRPSNAEQAANAVFAVLSRHVDREQLIRVRNALSEKVRRIWPETLLEDPGRRPSVGRHARIQQRAHEIWDRMGRPDGQSTDHWLQAEVEVDADADRQTEAKGNKALVRRPRARKASGTQARRTG